MWRTEKRWGSGAWLGVAMLAVASGCTSPQGPAAAALPSSDVEPAAEVSPAADLDRWVADVAFDGERWHVAYSFPVAQRALLFDSAHGTYRATHWSSVPAVSLESLHGLDGLFFEAPATAVRFDITPPATATEGTTAFVPFSDGTHAFWAGQLALLTVESREAAAALGGNLRAWRGQQPEIHVRVRSDTPLIGPDGAGQRFTGLAHQGHGPFFYAGHSDDPMLIVDPGLPDWVKTAFRGRMPEVQRVLEGMWTQRLPRPQLMLAWGGGTGSWSNRGRAEDRQIVMLIQGEQYLETDVGLLGDLVWFFAHEMTHLHQFVDHGDDAESWMIEGFADTMATHVLVRIGLWNHAALERRYWSVARECARELSKGALAAARGRVAYVCGDLVGVALMALLPDHDLARLWKETRRGAHQGVTRARLLETARRLGASEEGLAGVDAFVTGDHGDTDRAIASLLESARLDPKYVNGSLSSLSFPFR